MQLTSIFGVTLLPGQRMIFVLPLSAGESLTAGMAAGEAGSKPGVVISTLRRVSGPAAGQPAFHSMVASRMPVQSLIGLLESGALTPHFFARAAPTVIFTLGLSVSGDGGAGGA